MLNPCIQTSLVLLTLLYPLAVYFGVNAWGISSLAALLLVIGSLHLYRAIRGQRSSWLWAGACLLLALWSWMQNSSLGLKFYPVLISLGMLCLFGWSLLYPPSAVERIARLQEPDLDDQGVAYTRKVTQVWCLFFLFNAAIAGATIWSGSDKLWALYNGLISYLLMGLLFAVEWLIRRKIRRDTHSEIRRSVAHTTADTNKQTVKQERATP